MAEKGIATSAIIAVVIAVVAVAAAMGYFFLATPPGEGGPSAGGEDIDWTGANVFTDPKGDFWLGGGSPPQVIEYPPSDIIKIYVTNDNQYLYFKFEVDGVIPTPPVAYDGDTIRILTMNCAIDSDQDNSTGAVMNYAGGDLALDAFFGSPPEAGGEFYEFIKYYVYDSTASEGTGEGGSGTRLAGGPGENFVTLRFSLADLNLQSGMKVNISPWVEVESDLYHHFARDVCLSEDEWYTDIEIL